MKLLPKEILRDIKNGSKNPYSLLDDFSGYLTGKIAPHTVQLYVSSVKRWLQNEDIEISNQKLKDKITMPRVYAITRDRAPTTPELKRMLLHTDLRGKVLISMLASSGMRIGELLSLRVMDIDFRSYGV